MKKLLLLLSVVLLGSAAWAAVDVEAPNPGETATYKITADAGSSTIFSIITSATAAGDISDNLLDHIGTPSTGTDLRVSSAATAIDGPITVAAGTDKTWTKTGADASLDITWNASSSSNIYYVVAETTTSTAGICNNNVKIWRVTPGSKGLLAITKVELVTDKGADNSGNDICQSNVVSAKYTTANGFEYDYGYEYIYLKITSSGCSTTNITDGWTPAVTVVDQGAITGNLTNVIAGIEYTTEDITSVATPTWAAAKVIQDDVVYARIKITNEDASGKQWEGTSNKILSIFVDGTDEVYGDDGNSAASTGFTGPNDSVEETIKARPTMGTTPAPTHATNMQ